MRIHLTSKSEPSKKNRSENNKDTMNLKWEKFSLIVIGFSILLCLIPICLYFLKFGAWLNFGNTKEFAEFGSYFGGVVTPIFSFATLLIVLYTVKLQVQSLSNQEEALNQSQAEFLETKASYEKQFKHSKNETKKNDVYRVILTLSDRLEKLYREPIYFLSVGELKKRELHFILNFASDEALGQIIKPETPPPPEHEDELLKTKTVLTLLHETIVKLAVHLNFLYQYGESDSSLFFYEPIINHLASKLKVVGYLPPDDEATLIMLREFRQRSKSVSS